MDMLSLIASSVEIGLILAGVTFGVALAFRVLRFPDLTVDASYVTGAAVSAMALHAHLPAWVSILLGVLVAALAGSFTGFLHAWLGVSKILSGILSMGIFYTINLRIMHGPNVSLLSFQEEILPWLSYPLNHTYTLIAIGLSVILLMYILWRFLESSVGLRVRAVGENEETAKAFAIHPKWMKLAGLTIANGCVGFAGANMAQLQGFVDVNMGIGIIVSGLAAYMIGEAISPPSSVPRLLLACVIGSIIYQLIITISLQAGLAPTDLKGMTAAIAILALVTSKWTRTSYGSSLLRD